MADAIRLYAKQAQNIDAERQAAAIRIRAERRWGQMFRDAAKAKGARGTGSNQHKKVRSVESTAPKLEDLGVSKDQSSKWQKLAEPSDDAFEEALSKARSASCRTWA